MPYPVETKTPTERAKEMLLCAQYLQNNLADARGEKWLLRNIAAAVVLLLQDKALSLGEPSIQTYKDPQNV